MFGKPRSSPSGPSPEQIREEQLRQQRIAEAQRAEQARIEAENQRRLNIQRAAQWRARIDRAEEEMAEELGGTFDLPKRKSTAIFGTEGNPDETALRAEIEAVAARVQKDSIMLSNLQIDFRSTQQAQHDNEARMRANEVWGDPSVVDLRPGPAKYLLDDAVHLDPRWHRDYPGVSDFGTVGRARDTDEYWRTGKFGDSRDRPFPDAGPSADHPSLYNPLREPERARADFMVDKARVDSQEMNQSDHIAWQDENRKWWDRESAIDKYYLSPKSDPNVAVRMERESTRIRDDNYRLYEQRRITAPDGSDGR